MVTDQQAAGPRQVADWNQLEGWWMQTDLFSGAAERDVSEGGGLTALVFVYIYPATLTLDPVVPVAEGIVCTQPAQRVARRGHAC